MPTAVGHKPLDLNLYGAARSITGLPFAVAVVLLISGTCSYAQQTTGQLLISSGFNPIAATTPEMMTRLLSFPANQFLLRKKGGRPFYVYSDPSGCSCAYVGSVAAMDRYRVSFRNLPADVLSSGGLTDPEQNLINSMEQDDAGAQFNNDVFGPDF